MKIDSYSIRLVYSTTSDGQSSSHTVEVPARGTKCDVSELGATAMEQVQKVLDMHCDTARLNAMQAKLDKALLDLATMRAVEAKPEPKPEPVAKKRGKSRG